MQGTYTTSVGVYAQLMQVECVFLGWYQKTVVAILKLVLTRALAAPPTTGRKFSLLARWNLFNIRELPGAPTPQHLGKASLPFRH